MAFLLCSDIAGFITGAAIDMDTGARPME